MKEKHSFQKKAGYPAQATVILRLAAGGYLLYLSWGLIQGIFAQAGGRRIMQAAFALFYLAFGALLAGWSAKKLIKGEFTRPGQIPEEDASEEQEPEKEAD